MNSTPKCLFVRERTADGREGYDGTIEKGFTIEMGNGYVAV